MKRLKIILLFSLLSFSFFGSSEAQQPIKINTLHSGDLIFQSLDCGSLCAAIEAVTPGFKGHHFSHVGIIYKHKNRLMVIEAIGKEVHLSPLSKVIKRSPLTSFIGRLKGKDTLMIDSMLHFALRQIGVPYDDAFLYDNGKYYCSELVFDAFKYANRGIPFFKMQPMTFKIPGSSKTFKVWEHYFKSRNQPIPEGKPGCNPGSIITSKKINVFLLKLTR